MGLDMFLNASRYVRNQDIGKELADRLLSDKIRNLPDAGVSRIVINVGYWRKANAIHHWFVENVQDGIDDCKDYWVSREDLHLLLGTVNDVLKNPEKADQLLPTSTGFFFGSTHYDEWYMSDLDYTKTVLETILDDESMADCDFYYHASW